ASEAKQSIVPHGRMDCFRLRSLSFGGQVIASMPPSFVMPGLAPGIHVLAARRMTWMAGSSPAMTDGTAQAKGPRDRLAQPIVDKVPDRRSEPLPQNIRPSLTSTQRPFLICWTWVIVLARWSVLENLVGGELKISRNLSPDSSASIIFWPVRSLPALLA